MLEQKEIDELVREAADNCFDNGYEHWLSPNELAMDMCSCDADIEQHEVEIIEETIIRLNILKKEVVGYVIVRSPDEAPKSGT